MPGHLSREAMLDVLKNGGGILIGHNIITHPDMLPSEAALAAGNPDRANAALEALTSRRAALDHEISALQTHVNDLQMTPQAETVEEEGVAKEESEAPAEVAARGRGRPPKSAAQKNAEQGVAEDFIGGDGEGSRQTEPGGRGPTYDSNKDKNK